MNYGTFESLRRPTWARLARLLKRARDSPQTLGYDELEELSVVYRQVLHDYSLATARFPGTEITRDLRRLVLDATHFLQRDSGSRLPSLHRFVTRDFPAAMAKAAPAILVAALLFSATSLFGFALTAQNPSMGAYFVGPQAVQGLEDGELWTDSIFAVTPGAIASSKIATNNLSVALTAWGGGVLGGLGAFWVICLNGLMLGSVLALTAHYSLAHALLEFIGAHGPLEITMILVTAGAGLHIGASMVRATDLPRSVEMRRAGRTGLTILLGCLPWILLLGFVEGFVSPSVDVSVTAKWTLGFLLESIFLFWAFLSTLQAQAAPAVPTVPAAPGVDRG